jgi:cell wall-associated NlpC family hydrolase
MRRSAMRRTAQAGVVATMVVGLLLTVTNQAVAMSDSSDVTISDEEWAQYQAWLCDAFGWCELDGLYAPVTQDAQLPPDGTDSSLGVDAGVPADVPDPATSGVPEPAAEAPAAPATGVSSAVVQFALGQVGKPYVWGGAGPNGFDCSGLTLRAFGSANIVLPRTARDQYNAGQHLPVTQAQPGDLLFWASDGSTPATIYHVALYIGGAKIVEASQQGVPVRVRPIDFNERQLVRTATRPGS